MSLDKIPEKNVPEKTNARKAIDNYKFGKLRVQRAHLLKKRSFRNLSAEENAQLRILEDVLNK